MAFFAIVRKPEATSRGWALKPGQKKSGESRDRPIADWNCRPGNLFPVEAVKSAYGLANELDKEK